MTSMTPVDAAWFRMDERRNQADIAAFMQLEGTLEDSAICELLERRLLTHRRFRERAVDTRARIAPPRWEPERDFSLDAHLVRRSVPGGDAGLRALLGDLMSTPIDMARSPWKITLLDGLAKGTGLFVRVHHCMGDGFALLDILMSLATADTADRQQPTPSPPRAVRPPPTTEGALASLAYLVMLPFDPPSALKGELSGTRHVAWSEPFAVDRLKAGARARDATINDIVMTALGGAVRRVLMERADADRVPSVRAIMPVNLRPREQPVDLEHGNWFGLVFVDLGTNAARPEHRLSEMKGQMNRLKGSRQAVVALGILTALGRSPAAVDRLVDRIFARKASMVATNVPGPRARIRLAGRSVLDLLFWAPHPAGLGCGISVISYAGSLRAGVRTDAAIGVDPERLARAFSAELHALSDDEPAPYHGVAVSP